MENYLFHRIQYVVYNGVQSERKSVTCGIPQGSILGPILFLLYINDLANVSKKLKFILFADDTNVFYTGKKLNDVISVLNDELKYMSIWFKINKLSLNVGKTNYMIFKNKKDNKVCNLIIDGVNVEKVHVTKFLGVKVDDQLTWNDQINSVCTHLSKNISILYRVKHVLNSHSMHTLYCTLILPYLNYACEIWGNTFETRLTRIVHLQKKLSD